MPYLLTVKAVHCSDGETMESAEAQAVDKNHVLDTLDKAASEIDLGPLDIAPRSTHRRSTIYVHRWYICDNLC